MRGKTQYAFLNRIAKSGGIVVWGSTTLAELPLNELLKNYDVSGYIYNRSIPGLTLSDAENYLDACVFGLAPEKVILNLGEADITDADNISRLMEQYRWILYKIHITLPKCALIITTIREKSALHKKFNSELRKLALEFGCTFYTVPNAADEEEYGLSFINAVKISLYDEKLSYSDIAARAVFSVMTH